ncbi:MAG TPA: IS110 family transposase [Chloroflexota bacterium]|nr:IS110 family transposase [Chloroflexota bacterium]
MDVVYDVCAGIDVHKKTVVACRMGSGRRQTRTFGTTTGELLELSDWLAEAGVTHVGIESTGEFWRPVHNILEGNFEVWLLNAQHIKAVPGRKTDVADAEWIAQLVRHALVRPSFIPPREQRDLRELTRHRTNFVRERATLIHRVQKVLEGTNIKLSSVASDVLGLSGRDMLAAIVAGEDDPGTLAELARGKLRKKREELEAALTGHVRPHHRFLLAELLVQIESVEETIGRFDAQIKVMCEVDEKEEVIELLDTIPGVGRPTAEMLIAEIGTDMSRFPTAAHLASWAGLAPGNNESASKRRSGKTRRGNVWLRSAMVAAAQSAVRSRKTSYYSQYQRLKARRGVKRAILAVAHSMLVSAYYVISRRELYRELGPDYYDRRKPAATAHKLTQRLRNLGFHVIVTPRAESVQAVPLGAFSG